MPDTAFLLPSLRTDGISHCQVLMRFIHSPYQETRLAKHQRAADREVSITLPQLDLQPGEHLTLGESPQKTASTWVQTQRLKATNVGNQCPLKKVYFFKYKNMRQPLKVIHSYYLTGLFVRTATINSCFKGYSTEYYLQILRHPRKLI